MELRLSVITRKCGLNLGMKIWPYSVFTVGRLAMLKKCADRKRDAIRGSLLEGQYGEWLKAEGTYMGTKQHVRIE